MNLVRKISAKTVCGEIKAIVNDVKDKDGKFTPFALFTLICVASGIKTGTTDKGDWVAFTGDFEAHNKSTGEVFRAPQAFVPEPAQGMIQAALVENDTVEMAFEIGVTYDDNAFGYSYTVKPLIKPQENDAISLLRQKALGLEHKPEAESEAPKAKAKKSK